MNREEEIKQVAENYASQMCKNCAAMLYCEEKNKKCVERREQENVYVDGAKWADEHPVDVWHDVSEEPKDYLTQILYQDRYGICWTASKQEKFEYDWDWERFATAHLMVRWAYINDLLPKGGEE